MKYNTSRLLEITMWTQLWKRERGEKNVKVSTFLETIMGDFTQKGKPKHLLKVQPLKERKSKPETGRIYLQNMYQIKDWYPKYTKNL